jgi:hypothetical protein
MGLKNGNHWFCNFKKFHQKITNCFWLQIFESSQIWVEFLTSSFDKVF